MKQVVRTLAFAAVAAAVLTACGGDGDGDKKDSATKSPSAAAKQAAFNDADVMFAQMMIPHHEQAVEMAKEAPAKAGSAEVKNLAAKIGAAQAPEITLMKGWLTAWGKPQAMASGMGHDMSGMMSDADMTKFKASSGAEFDKQFLTMMIAHHNGAITMADSELKSGTNPEARKLAEQIKSAQAAEVKEMQTLLGGQTTGAHH